MAGKQGKDVRVLFGTYDFSSASTQVNVNLESLPLDPTVFTDAAQRVMAGNRQDSIEWAGLFNDDGTSVNAAGSAMIGSGTNNILSVLLGTGQGSRAYSGAVYLMAAKNPGRLGELVRQEVILRSDQALQPTQLISLKFATTSDGDNPGAYDYGASATAGGTAFLHIHSYSGTGTVTIQVLHSTLGTTFAGIGSIISGPSGTSGEVAIIGTVQRYVMWNQATVSGTGGTSSVTMTFRRL